MSSLLLDEMYDDADPRFVHEVFASTAEKKLGALASPWFADQRPPMREMLLQYVDDGCDRAHHRALVKRLFKLAEAAEDDALMARFMVAFDRMPRREMGSVSAWDYATRQSYPRAVVQAKPEIPVDAEAAKQRAFDRFSAKTRTYLVRRTWRYFRRMGHVDPARYVRTMGDALVRYRDEDLDDPAKLLDAWGLFHALYWATDACRRDPAGIVLRSGHSLAELSFAPIYPEAWASAFEPVLGRLGRARSRPVVMFLLDVLQRHHAEALAGLTLAQLRPLLESPREEIQVFSAQQLRTVQGLETLRVRDWIVLLTLRNQHALPVVCELVAQHVTPERLTLDQCIGLASSPMAPVADLGLGWVRQKVGDAPADRQPLRQLLQARTAGVRDEASRWLTDLLRTSPDAAPEEVRDLLDAKYAEIRQHALDLMDADDRFGSSPVLWAAMAESPHADARHRLVQQLSAPGPAPLEHEVKRQLWSTTLLSVGRGSRAKRHALRQLSAQLRARPEQADALLPLLRIALRSVRPAERRHALAAVARAAFERPEVHEAVARHIPELQLFAPQEATP